MSIHLCTENDAINSIMCTLQKSPVYRYTRVSKSRRLRRGKDASHIKEGKNSNEKILSRKQ